MTGEDVITYCYQNDLDKQKAIRLNSNDLMSNIEVLKGISCVYQTYLELTLYSCIVGIKWYQI